MFEELNDSGRRTLIDSIESIPGYNKNLKFNILKALIKKAASKATFYIMKVCFEAWLVYLIIKNI